MERRIEKRVDSWESGSFTDGHDELRDLASEEFSGAIDAAGTQVFMLNGRIIGVFGGTIEDLETAQGTLFRAPHPSLSLLYTMQQKGGETRAKYYTEETSLQAVDQKLSEGSFTGYIELSENVLSGDYYHVYYGGRAMHAAFVGTQEDLITDEEAFEQASDEVGIYEVIDVDIDITEIPADDAGSADPTETASDQAASRAGQSRGTDQSPETGQQPADTRPSQGQPPPGTDGQQSPSTSSGGGQPGENQQRRADSQRRHAADGQAGEQRTPTEGATGASRADQPAEPSTGRTQPEDQRAPEDRGQDPRGAAPSDRAEPTQTERSSAGGGTSDGGQARSDTGAGSADDAAGSTPAREQPSADGAASSRFDKEAAWREAETIPSLDPDRTDAPGRAEQSQDASSAQRSASQSRNTVRERDGGTEGEDVDTAFDAEVLEREDRIDRLTQRVTDLETERDDLRRERDELARTAEQLREENTNLEDELDRLRGEVDRLERELSAAQSGGTSAGGAVDTGASTGQQLTSEEALSGTDLFVRYSSKSDATLEDVHAGNASAEEVNGNLRLEQHTRFEAENATVDGTSYLSFLRETLEYRFVQWFVMRLPYEIRDTGHTDALRDLYDAYSVIDRAELDGAISIEYTEDGETIREQTTFDVVIRDRMGSPLVVANLNDQRDPASEEMMVELNEAAMRVKESNDALGAAVLVTESFFSPGALETAAEATGGSFLSRDSRESFVKLSRKRGYHLCLVEARGDDFHLNEPEL
jgi:FtsZ-binding cell division protein ZapB